MKATSQVPRLTMQYLSMTTGLLTTVTCGINTGWPSIALPQLLNPESPIHITNNEGSWIAIMPLLGSIFGNIFAALLVDVIGRKKVIQFAAFPSFITWIVIAYAPNVSSILAARFFAGTADGAGFCVLPLYLGEIADPSIRGFIGTSIITARIFGTLIINVAGSYLDLTATGLVASMFPVLGFVTFMWMPESPYYFLKKQNFEAAENSLKLFKGSNDVGKELERLKKAIREQEENGGKFFDLFTVMSNRKALYVILVALGTQQLSGNTAITYYAKTIFQTSENVVSSDLANIIFFSVELIVSAGCSMLVDHTGRKPLLIISVVGTSLALLMEGTFSFLQEVMKVDTTEFEWIPIVAMIFYVIIFSTGIQTIPCLLVAEVFPINVKAFASAFASIYFCIITSAVSKFFQFTKDEYGLHVPFFTFTAVCVFGLVLIIFFIPETKGKTLEDIQEKLKGTKAVI